MRTVFRSKRRSVVYPQAEHARLSGTIAAAWGNETFSRPAMDFASFVRGVALHDRGYGELDADGIGEVPEDRWTEIQRRSFTPRGEDPIVDLVVALHVHRLARLPEMETALPRLLAAAGVSEPEARAADAITNLCDLVSFDVCFEEPRERSASVPPAAGAAPVEIRIAFDGAGLVTLTPWPFALPWLAPIVTGFRADGYPDTLEPVVEPLRLQHASAQSDGAVHLD
jgi:hypothetical protein